MPLTKDQKTKIRITSEMINAFYAMPDAALGKSLVDLSEKAWLEIESKYGSIEESRITKIHRDTYLGGLIFDIIPAIAARLGYQVPGFSKKEEYNGLSIKTDQDFRLLAINVLKNSPANSIPQLKDRPTAFQLLNHNIANGNPVMIALDRIIKPLPNNRQDWAACYIREAAHFRGLGDQIDTWSPNMQNYSLAQFNFEDNKVDHEDDENRLSV